MSSASHRETTPGALGVQGHGPSPPLSRPVPRNPTDPAQPHTHPPSPPGPSPEGFPGLHPWGHMTADPCPLLNPGCLLTAGPQLPMWEQHGQKPCWTPSCSDGLGQKLPADSGNPVGGGGNRAGTAPKAHREPTQYNRGGRGCRAVPGGETHSPTLGPGKHAVTADRYPETQCPRAPSQGSPKQTHGKDNLQHRPSWGSQERTRPAPESSGGRRAQRWDGRKQREDQLLR